MQRELLPVHVVDDSVEHLARHGRGGHTMYLVVLALVLIAFGALPVISVDISVQSSGIIRPSVEKHDVRARVSGVAAEVRVRENEAVREGDVLAVIQSTAVGERSALVRDQIAAKQAEISDTDLLGREAERGIDLSRFRADAPRQEYLQFRDELATSRMEEAAAARELDRARLLAERGFAPASDVEAKQLAVRRAAAASRAIIERYHAQWQTRLATVRLDLRALQSSRDQIDEEHALYAITAPVAGTIEELAGISGGSYVQAGDRIAVISPSSRLVADVFVSPDNVGLVRRGGGVRMMIDAFNYTDWGIITGRVLEVSDDFLDSGNQPVFKVRCALDQDHLALPNGFVGRLRKGMTLRARFVVAHRSLLQLLRDDVSDWLDPARSAPRAAELAGAAG